MLKKESYGIIQMKKQNKFEIELDKLKLFDEKTKSIKRYFYGQRSRYIDNYDMIKKFLSLNNRILDVGANPLYFLATLKRLGYHIEGLDINPNLDSDLIKKESLKITKCDIEKEKFPYEDHSFDVVILSEVFEHLYVNPLHCMREIKRILKKDGKLILTTPNGYSLKCIGNFVLGRGLSENPFREFNLMNTHCYRGHIREYSMGELKDFLQKTNFKIEDSFYISYEHVGLRNKNLLRIFSKFIYFIFPKFKSHIIIIAK